jgi:hypothetical protein
MDLYGNHFHASFVLIDYIEFVFEANPRNDLNSYYKNRQVTNAKNCF